MPSDSIEVPVGSIPEGFISENKKPSLEVPEKSSEDNFKLRILQLTLILLANVFIGIILGSGFLYAFRNGLDFFLSSSTSVHIILCVGGYQLLMAQAILSLAPENGWSAKLTLVQKRRAHWILQISGSIAAISGSFYKIVDKNVHWNTWHGIFALVALVFVSVSLVNGLTSLYAYELRRFLSGNISKFTHICFGIVGFTASSVSLIYGFLKNGFQNWASPTVANTLIAFTVILTFVVILIPVITLYRKSVIMIKNR